MLGQLLRHHCHVWSMGVKYKLNGSREVGEHRGFSRSRHASGVWIADCVVVLQRLRSRTSQSERRWRRAREPLSLAENNDNLGLGGSTKIKTISYLIVTFWNMQVLPGGPNFWSNTRLSEILSIKHFLSRVQRRVNLMTTYVQRHSIHSKVLRYSRCAHRDARRVGKPIHCRISVTGRGA